MAGHERETEDRVGWGRSDKFTFTIPAANTGANIGNIDLGRNYAYIILRCGLCTGIAASTTLGIEGALDENEAMDSLYYLEANVLTKIAPTLPTSGSMQVLITPAFGVQFIHFTLSKNSTGIVTFEVYGIAESVKG